MMLKKPVAALLLVILLPQLTGCIIHRTKQLPPEKALKPAAEPPNVQWQDEAIVGVTMKDGREIRFRSGTRAYIESDTLFGLTAARKPFRAPLGDIQRVSVRRVNVGRSLLATFAVLVGITGIGVLIILSTKESCPFVYSWDGERYVFDAEPYGGATTRGLERDDWTVLGHLRPERGEYRLALTNEVNETQYTNLLELLVVDHPAGMAVIPDPQGVLHGLARVQPPRSARDRDGQDLLPWLAHTDQAIWEPMAVPNGAGDLRQEVTLTFARPAGATHAQLVTNVATGLWGSHMIRAMLELWGSDVGQWYQGLDSRQSARDSLLFWNLREEIYALKVYVEEPGGWQLGGVLEGGGPFIAAQRVLPLDLSRVVGDSVRIRLRPPVGFWALNSFGMDFGPDQPLRPDTVPLATAHDSSGSILATLRAADTSYYVMPDKGDRARLTFRAPPARPGLERTVLLHARGFYRLHLDAAGPADTAMLRRLSAEPGATARFAAERFAAWQLARRPNP
jgi:hypothetical protein